ncbi:MAG TPA: urea transporter [Methylomirabilota bacterium]|jgi:NAD-dependent deacetylase
MTGRFVRLDREIGHAAAAGYGQVLFAESPLGGLLMLLGLIPLAPRAAAGAAVACTLASVLARLRGYPYPEWRRGLYGYAAALTGVFWGLLFAPTKQAWLVLGLAALTAPWLTRQTHRLLTPRQIPCVAGPALILTWAAWLVLTPAAPSPATGWLALATGWGLTLAGLAVSSRLLAATGVVGAVVGLAVGAALGGVGTPGIVANSVPTAIALGGVFLAFSSAALGVAALGAAVAGALWWALMVHAGVPLPVLVAPFSLVTIAVVAALRSPRLRRMVPGRPAPLPLAAIGSPEIAWRARLAQDRLHALAVSARKICVLTGAGVSTSAGLPDFRGPSGLWTRTRDIQLADFVRSAEARAAYWQEEQRFFRLVRGVSPAPVHRALAALGRQGRLSAVVTQNVDGLHQAAGLPADTVIELHGSIREAFCLDCGHVVERATLSTRLESGRSALYCPVCQGLLKGGSVMFGERVSPPRLDAALRAVLAADLLLVLGTSLLVAPASELLRWARDAGVPIAIVNATPTPYDGDATVTLAADVDAVMADLVEALAELRAA